MKQLVIIRGPSGSGKTTIARHLASQNESSLICEADRWWGSDYKWTLKKLGKAHQWCRLEVERGMLDDVEQIIVANVFIKLKDLTEYLKLAEEYGYEVTIIRSPGIWHIDNLIANNDKRDRINTPEFVLKRHILEYQKGTLEREWKDLSIYEN